VILSLGAPSANFDHPSDNFRMTKIEAESSGVFESKYARYAIAALHPALYSSPGNGEGFEQGRKFLAQDIMAGAKAGHRGKERAKDGAVLIIVLMLERPEG